MNNSGRLSKHASKKNDNWVRSSKKKLKASVEHKCKRIYVGLLDLLDIERMSGRISDETCSGLRSKILSIGNDQIRNIKKEIDDRYNVEFIPYQMEFKVSPMEGIDPITGGKK